MLIKPINPIAKMVAYARERFATKKTKPKKGKGSYERDKTKRIIKKEIDKY
tara:strand:- start:82 stop:234 length:153 start_codon:yes stop_codon:yes gene_type:complete